MRRAWLALAACSVFSVLAAAEDEPFTPAEYEAAVAATRRDYTVHAVVGPSQTPLPLELSHFLLDHPDLSAFIVNARAIAPYRIIMRGPRRSLADDGDGTRGVVNLLESAPDRRLYYGEGVHRSALFPDILAAAVIEMKLHEVRGPDGRAETISTFDVWVRLRSRWLSGVVKTLRPFLQGTVVGKFTKAFLVADAVGRDLARDPASVSADAFRFPLLSPDERAQFTALVARLPSPRP
jgi:hypothetical protein